MNPITAWRERLGWSRQVAALQMGCSYVDLTLTERGYYKRLPPRILQALERVGIDAAGMQAEYKAWREQQAGALRLRQEA